MIGYMEKMLLTNGTEREEKERKEKRHVEDKGNTGKDRAIDKKK